VTVLLPVIVFAAENLNNDDFKAQVEADWLLQEAHRAGRGLQGALIDWRAADAAGGCDGIKNGKPGFHTSIGGEPWWQVDLGTVRHIDRVIVWNYCLNERAAGRARSLVIRFSEDGRQWRTVYHHHGQVFYGFTDDKPLVVGLEKERARYVRAQLPGRNVLHLDEIEVFSADDPGRNLALHQPATQVNCSWGSSIAYPAGGPPDWQQRAREVLAHSRDLAGELTEQGVDTSDATQRAKALELALNAPSTETSAESLYLQARWLQRRLTLADPLLDFDAILFNKRVPGVYNHMSDQYYGWWSRPGGGIYILRNFRGDSPTMTCLTESFKEPGSFLRPMISWDATKVLFAWCRHVPKLAAEQDKLDKANVPEDAFYHVFEMDIDGTNVRQLTRGKYDDFDARYLPDGRILFLSTRRGQFVQVGRDSATRTVQTGDLPDVYVRCGGGPQRPVSVYTLHTMNPDGTGLCAVSPFAMFEWTPSVAGDGTILYSRWDYVDRDNQPWMSLWSINPDGTSARLIYGNFTEAPNATFEPRSIPNSSKIVFTGSAHHAQTMGSLVLLDPTLGTEGDTPVTRLTPEVPFPEAEGRPETFYANPWPLSERLYLVSWGVERGVQEGGRRPPNGMGIYCFDAAGDLELLYRDPSISSACPIPVRPRPPAPVLASQTDRDQPQEGRFLLLDVRRGLETVEPGEIKALRIVAIPPKTHPTMDLPNLGHTGDDPGKCVLGTVPVEADGSAYFRVPAGVPLFFQALDARGMAVQTMRSATYVQPGQTLGCIGCHEKRTQAPPSRRPQAAARDPSRIAVGPSGSWPLRFDRLVQPVLDRYCVSCHRPNGADPDATRCDLTPAKAYESLSHYGTPSLYDHMRTRYYQSRSIEDHCAASESPLLRVLIGKQDTHAGVDLDPESRERLIVWMDTYAQRTGSFDQMQEQQLIELRRRHRDLLVERALGGSVSHAQGNTLTPSAD
jgi:hypothetical protein